MKKPYAKKIGDVSGFKIWYVNGFWIRKNLDEDFTNFGSNHHFNFIPKTEFWIDEESGKPEAKYFIHNFLNTEKEIRKGKSYEQAVDIAEALEKREREKSKLIKRIKKMKLKKEIIDKIHKKKLFTQYTNKLKIILVRGELVRSLFYTDFTEGGHGFVYHFVPKDEVWIDDDVYKKEIPYVLIHELHERALMAQGWGYDPLGGMGVFSRKSKSRKEKSAHFAAEDLEFWCRNHPSKMKKILINEIKNNEKFV